MNVHLVMQIILFFCGTTYREESYNQGLRRFRGAKSTNSTSSPGSL